MSEQPNMHDSGLAGHGSGELSAPPAGHVPLPVALLAAPPAKSIVAQCASLNRGGGDIPPHDGISTPAEMQNVEGGRPPVFASSASASSSALPITASRCAFLFPSAPAELALTAPVYRYDPSGSSQMTMEQLAMDEQHSGGMDKNFVVKRPSKVVRLKCKRLADQAIEAARASRSPKDIQALHELAYQNTYLHSLLRQALREFTDYPSPA